VLDQLRRRGTASQSDLARATGLSRATVLNIVRELAESRLVTLSDGERSGRRTVDVSLNRDAGFVVGVDFGHRHMRMVVGDLAHTVVAETHRRLELGHSAQDDVRLVSELLDDLLTEAGTDRSRVLAVAVGLPAPVDQRSGEVGSSSILPGWVGVPAVDTIADALGVPTVVDNDANLGAIAELTWGAAAGCSDIVYIKAATGIGAGIVIGGDVFHGAAGTAGEIGHMTLDETGALCRCGNRGCLESYAGSSALVELLRSSHGPDVTPERLIELALGGDPGARRVLADAGRSIGVAVANLCNLIAPERVVVGGELVRTGSLLLEPIRDMVRRRSIPTAAHTAEIVPGSLGDRAEVLGAMARAVLAVTPRQLVPLPP
jgi:predicted NBD/HSP70 family sugar kinase